MNDNTPKLDFIISRLDRIEMKVDDQGEKLYDIHGEVSGLKVRTSFIAVIAGTISGAFTSLMALLTRGH
jgi:hypothetical protein